MENAKKLDYQYKYSRRDQWFELKTYPHILS